jgi:hypothetical protein
MKQITDRSFRYHDSTSHGTSEGLRARMRLYAKQVKQKQAKATVTPIKAKRNG